MDADQAYQTLELKDDASLDAIKTTYRRMALELHPDKNSAEKDGLRFKEISEAYNVLKKYHKSGKKKAPQTERATGPQKWGPPKESPPEQDWGKFTQDFEGDSEWWNKYKKEFWKQYDENVATGGEQQFEKTQEPEKQPDLFVDVEQSLCIGCCSCEIIAPDVFQINRNTQINPKSRVINMKGAGLNKIMNAAETCPTKAINVENKRTMERLFPH